MRPNHMRAAVVISLVAGGCVEPFGGSNVQINFAETVPAPATGGVLPPDTFLTVYAVKFQVQAGDDGASEVTDSFVFPVVSFEIRPVIDVDSPCFIELEESRFPGLHVTQFAAALRQDTGVANPAAPPPGTPPEVITDILDADRRMGFLGALEGAIKVVVGASDASYPVPGNACVPDGGDPARIPPPACIDDDSNALRLSLCNALWSREPGLYEGNDKVFTLPLNGDFFGTVSGMNPINNGFIGGAGFFVDTVLADIDSLLVNWQFKDLDRDGEPDYPDDFPQRSSIGFHFMQGAPVQQTRGTSHVTLENDRFAQIRGEAVIFAGLSGDDVSF